MFKDLKKIFRSFDKKERTVFFITLTTLILSSLFAGAGVVAQTTIIAPAEGGQYIEAIIGQPIAINPILSTGNNADEDMVTVLFADLLTLAKSYSTSSDGSVWSVVLQEGLVWSDGQPITSDDVVFTVQTIQDKNAGSLLQNQWKGIIVERRSEREVVFTLKSGYSYFDETLRSLRVAPKHIFGVIPPSNLRLSNYNLEPVSSGPYKFVSYEKEKNGFISSYKLVINPNYPGKKALIEGLTFRFFATYSDAIIAFNQKEINGLGGIESASASEIKIVHNQYNLPINQYYALFFNPTVNVTLQDPTIRRALNLAIDKEKIVKVALGGGGTVSKGPLPPYSASYHAALYESDLFSEAQAESLLEERGWQISEEDGIRTKGTDKLIIEITVPDLPFLLQTAKQIKENWEAIGVLTLINTVPASIIQDQQIASRNYQALLFGNVPLTGEDIYSFWHSSGRFYPGKNLALYDNTKVNRLLEQNQKTFDKEARMQNLLAIQEYIYEDTPAIFLFAPNYIYVSSKTLGGLDETAITGGSDRLSHINTWFLKTDRVLR